MLMRDLQFLRTARIVVLGIAGAYLQGTSESEDRKEHDKSYTIGRLDSSNCSSTLSLVRRRLLRIA